MEQCIGLDSEQSPFRISFSRTGVFDFNFNCDAASLIGHFIFRWLAFMGQ